MLGRDRAYELRVIVELLKAETHYRNTRGYAYGFGTHDPHDDIYMWCLDQFGSPHWRQKRWYHAKNVFWFAQATDATAFKVRWL